MVHLSDGEDAQICLSECTFGMSLGEFQLVDGCFNYNKVKQLQQSHFLVRFLHIMHVNLPKLFSSDLGTCILLAAVTPEDLA